MNNQVKYINGFRQVDESLSIFAMTAGGDRRKETWVLLNLLWSLRSLHKLYEFKFFIKFELLPGPGIWWKRLHFTITIEYGVGKQIRSDLFRADHKGMLQAIDNTMVVCNEIWEKQTKEYLS